MRDRKHLVAAEVEKLLEVGVREGLDASIHNYAAFCLLRDRLDEAIKLYKDQLGKDNKLPVEKILAHLLSSRARVRASPDPGPSPLRPRPAEGRVFANDQRRGCQHLP